MLITVGQWMHPHVYRGCRLHSEGVKVRLDSLLNTGGRWIRLRLPHRLSPRHGYALDRLLHTLGTFMRHKYMPQAVSASVLRRVKTRVAEGR